MPQYQSVGKIPHKRHTQLRDEAGALRYEEMFSTQAFADVYALLYHVSPPTEVRSIEPGPNLALKEWVDDVHRHHLLDTFSQERSGDYLQSRRPILFNDESIVSVASPDRASEALYRNATFDELVCVGAGSGELVTPFGSIDYGPRDMIVLPRGTTQEWRPADGPQKMLILESRDPITIPSRYLTPSGQFSEHSPVCERDVRAPRLNPPRVERGDFPVLVKVEDRISIYHTAWHPFDLVGWDGCLYPYAINMDDFEPVARRIHTMPDEQQIFATKGACICCLVPRPMDWHEDAIPAPAYHSSIDIDEIIFNMAEKFMGWTRPSMGVTTFHPRGIAHGSKHEGVRRHRHHDRFHQAPAPDDGSQGHRR